MNVLPVGHRALLIVNTIVWHSAMRQLHFAPCSAQNRSSDVTDLIKATPEDDILRRDINDRPPIFSWCKGRVALLGDSAHAMQPNLGQGGCMAIEDAFQLGEDIGAALSKVGRTNAQSYLSIYQWVFPRTATNVAKGAAIVQRLSTATGVTSIVPTYGLRQGTVSALRAMKLSLSLVCLTSAETC